MKKKKKKKQEKLQQQQKRKGKTWNPFNREVSSAPHLIQLNIDSIENQLVHVVNKNGWFDHMFKYVVYNAYTCVYTKRYLFFNNVKGNEL